MGQVDRIAGMIALWVCLIGALSCGSNQEAGSGEKPNSPPSVVSITLSPEKPTVDREVSAFVQSQDPDGDTVVCQFQWLRNGEELIGEKGGTIKPGSFKKGDLVSVKVIPSDGKAEGKPLTSPALQVLNSAPVVQELWIEPTQPYVTDSLRVHVKTFDGDGDFIYYTYEWEKNETALPEAKAEVLEKGGFKKGDTITVTVTPDDREIKGPRRKSDPLVILNSPPVIVSPPSTTVEEGTYRYQVIAKDMDQDSLAYVLKSGPKGMEMNSATGLVRWEIPKDEKGTHGVELEVSDPEGAKGFQRFTLSVKDNK